MMALTIRTVMMMIKPGAIAAILYGLSRDEDGGILMAEVPEQKPTRTIKYKCPSCHTRLESPVEFGGKEDQCPVCGKTCIVPKTWRQMIADWKAIHDQERQRKRADEARRKKERKKSLPARRVRRVPIAIHCPYCGYTGEPIMARIPKATDGLFLFGELPLMLFLLPTLWFVNAATSKYAPQCPICRNWIPRGPMST